MTAVSLPEAPLVAQQQQPTKEVVMNSFDELLKKVPDTHYFPKAVMRNLLNKYSVDDLQKIYSDYQFLHELTFKNAQKELSYTVTAGAPAAGKSTQLEKLIGYDVATGTNSAGVVYVDPDRAVMIQMPSYREDRKNGVRDAESAYTHWREASNFIAQLFLAEALVDGYKIAHGNTMSVDQSITNLQAIQTKYSYKTLLLHFTTSDEIRLARERLRQQGGNFQVTPEDFASKSVKFFSLLPKYVSVSAVDFYYSKDVESTELAAKKALGEKSVVIQQELLDQIIALHALKGVENPGQYF